MWSRSRLTVALATLVVGVVSAAWWVTLDRKASDVAAEVVDSVCRSLGDEHAYAPVAGDLLDQVAETSDVQVRDLATPSAQQVATARTELLRTQLPGDTNGFRHRT